MALETKKVMISSTVRDLPEHREQVRSACERLGMFHPHMMENLTAADATAMEVSLRMVDQADIYVGILGFRYGYIPEGSEISVTEAEYRRAVERGIPRLMFVMSDAHSVTGPNIDVGANGEKLKQLKEEVKKERVVALFSSPEDLRGHVLQALLPYQSVADASVFHYVSDIPTPPEIYVAHPYSLLQSRDLIGRRKELNLLTDWVAKPDTDVFKAHILSITAIGGMGKSALTWKWFNDIAPEEMKPLAGRMWWSFYESDASFENFVIRALAYVTDGTIEEIKQIPSPDREAKLLRVLNHEPYLIVLDGLERLLIAYGRGDAARLNDSEVGTEKNVRKTADPRVGQFLRKLAGTKSARILLSTRLFPAELENAGGDPLPGTFNRELEGLTESDALALWRAFDVGGARDELQPVFDAIDRHPLLIQALAGEVKRFRPAPGDFTEWRKRNPHFDPAAYPNVKDAMAHVMEYALRDLGEKPRRVLETIAAFRMPTAYPTLLAILTGGEHPCGDETELDAILAELEDRGLVAWDRRANRYDLHPIVRGVVWNGLNDSDRQGVYTNLQGYFEAAPKVKFEDVNSLEDLTSAIELYHTLIGLGHYEDACELFYERLQEATLYRLSAGRERVELLEHLLPDGLDQLPRLSDSDYQSFILDALAAGYQFSGQPGRAVPLRQRANGIDSEQGDEKNLGIGMGNLSHNLHLTGGLRESEAAARRALVISRRREDRFSEGIGLYWLGLTLTARGEASGSASALHRSLRIVVEQSNRQGEGLVNAYLAQRAVWFGEFAAARRFASRAWVLAAIHKLETDFVQAARLLGEAALGLSEFAAADEHLHHALSRARSVNLVEEELPALTALAELRRRQGDGKSARELLDDVWEYAERGPYPLFHSDALNVLAQIERDAGNTAAAIVAATKAFRLAWCDSPPYAYHLGMIKARKHLEDLGVRLPEMPPFDESKFEPMPEVEIDPVDEFYVGAS
jgi:tetratricopeptide (TPR) repeat protein